jgi:HK97 family phage prohead protease
MGRRCAGPALLHSDPVFLIEHTGTALARAGNGTLRLEDNDTGLLCRATLDLRVPEAAGLVALVENRTIERMSVGFICGTDEWTSDFSRRTITEIREVIDCSAVARPAGPPRPSTSPAPRPSQTPTAAPRLNGWRSSAASLAPRTPRGAQSAEDIPTAHLRHADGRGHTARPSPPAALRTAAEKRRKLFEQGLTYREQRAARAGGVDRPEYR